MEYSIAECPEPDTAILKFSIRAAPELGVRAAHASPISIAFDGRNQSDGAVALGRIVADDKDALRLVTVVKPMPSFLKRG